MAHVGHELVFKMGCALGNFFFCRLAAPVCEDAASFLFAVMFLGEHATTREAIGILISVSGVLALVLGEGLGMLLTGSASALTGAPGSALLYGLIGLMAWPRKPRRFAVDWSDRPSGVATSAAARDNSTRGIAPAAISFCVSS